MRGEGDRGLEGERGSVKREGEGGSVRRGEVAV